MYADRTTKNEMYVEVSRARLNVEIFTTDKETLFKTAKKEDKQIDSMTAEKINYGKGKGEKNNPDLEKKIEPVKQKIEPAGIKHVQHLIGEVIAGAVGKIAPDTIDFAGI